MNYELLYLGLYFTGMSYLVNKAITYLTSVKYESYNDLIFEEYDENDKIYSRFTKNIKSSRLNLEEQPFIVNVTGDTSSMCLLNMFHSFVDNKENIGVLFLNDNTRRSEKKSKLIENICDINNITFFDYPLSDNTDILHKDLERVRKRNIYDTYEELCNGFDSKIIFEATNVNDNCINILDRIFNGDSLIEYSLENEKGNNFTIYKPFYNLNFEDIIESSNQYRIPFIEFKNESTNIKQELYHFAGNVDLIYPEWRENIYRLYRSNVGFERVLENKYNDLEKHFSNCETFKHGIIFTTENSYLPYEFFRYTIRKHINMSEFDITRLFFLFNSENIEVNGDLRNDYKFYYEEKRLIIYDNNSIQELFDNAELVSFRVDDSETTPHLITENLEPNLNKFLNGEDMEYIWSHNYNSFYNDVDIPYFILDNFTFKCFDVREGEDTSNIEYLIHIKNKD